MKGPPTHALGKANQDDKNALQNWMCPWTKAVHFDNTVVGTEARSYILMAE